MSYKSYKFRIYPNKTQEVLLNKTFGCIRYVWNQWVENFNKKEERIFKTPKQFKEELEWMREVSSAAIQQKEIDFKNFKNQFFNKRRKTKLGRPSFKLRRDKQSYRLPNQRFYIKNNKSKIPKIGFVKTIFDREISKDATFVNVTISKDSVGDFFISISVVENIQHKNKTGKEIGIDVGLKSFATFSNGDVVENPKFFRENQPKIRRIQQHLSRKIKGSNRYNYAKKQLASIHRKIDRKRSFFLHNLSSKLVNEFDVIAIEDLNVKKMIKNHHLAKSISDVAWSEFFRQLSYKSAWYGKKLQKSNRFYPTSKNCSMCGYHYSDMNLSVREWNCPCCGTHHDRDKNASINILNKSVGVDTELQAWREHKTFKNNELIKAASYEVPRIK